MISSDSMVFLALKTWWQVHGLGELLVMQCGVRMGHGGGRRCCGALSTGLLRRPRVNLSGYLGWCRETPWWVGMDRANVPGGPHGEQHKGEAGWAGDRVNLGFSPWRHRESKSIF
jgi:hypothetical protein